MKNITITVLLLLGLVFYVKSQNYQKKWSDGKLTWDDFKTEKNNYSTSELKFYIRYKTEKQKSQDTVIKRISTYCYISPNLSWVDPEYKMDKLLRYYQVVFDMVELYCRKLQIKFDFHSNGLDYEYLLESITLDLNEELSKFKKQSNSGEKEDVIILWESKIAKELQACNPQIIPAFTKSRWGYGLYGGLAVGSFSENLGNYFGQTYNVSFGFDFSFKKHIFFLNMILGACKAHADYKSDWEKNEIIPFTTGDISYGYMVLNNSKFRLTPYVGYGVSELSMKESNDSKKNKFRYTDDIFVFGLNVDYKLRKRISLIPSIFINKREYSEILLNTRIFVSKNNFNSELKGYAVHFSINIAGFGNLINLD